MTITTVKFERLSVISSKSFEGVVAAIKSAVGHPEMGAYVFITGRREAELSKAAKEIGKNVTPVPGDVSNLANLDRLAAQIKQEKGRLDIVFANAGVAKYAPLGQITEEFYDSIFDINVKGPPFYRSESTSADARWSLHHPQCICCRE